MILGNPRPGGRRRVCRAIGPALLLLAGLPAAGCGPRRPPAPLTAAIRFSDATRPAGIAWRHVNGASGRLFYPELVGGGGGLVDVDGDGYLDVVLVNSGALPGFSGSPGAHALYLNNRDGTFRDVSLQCGLAGPPYGMGIAAGDYDGDGRVDLYLTGVGEGRLFRNAGGGRFEDVTSEPLRNAGHWGTSASWSDVNRDGRLDLLVANYVRWKRELDVPCFMQGLRTYCGPGSYEPDRCTLLVNHGASGFRDESAAAGLDAARGKGLGVVARDLDRDGLPDFVVACDLVPNLLLRNTGGGFEELGVERGIAMGDRGLARAGMGIDAIEETGGRWAVFIGNLTEEGTAWYRETAGGLFDDESRARGLHAATLRVLTFGLAARDFDGDGLPDLALANGHIDLLARQTRGQSVRQPPLLFQGRPDGTLGEVTASAGGPFQASYLGRGLAWGDVDNDGDLDLLMVENNGPAHLWRNDTARRGAWLGIDCRMPGGGPAIGARVELTAGGVSRVLWCHGDGGYLGASDFRQVAALGSATRADRVRVRWPDGRTAEYRGLAGGRYWRLAPGTDPR